MIETDFLQPGLGLPCTAAEAAELVQATTGLSSINGSRLADNDPVTPLAQSIARSVAEADLTVHNRARRHPQCRLIGGRLLAIPPGLDDVPAGVAVFWTLRRLLALNWDWHGTYASTRQAMNTAIGAITRSFGYPAAPFGYSVAWLINGRLNNDPGADR